MKASFRQELMEAVDAIKEAHAGEQWSFPLALKATGEVCGAIERLVQQIGGNDEEFNALVLDCEWLVRTYVVPYDLPFVGPFVESTFIDPQLVNAVRPALDAMRIK